MIVCDASNCGVTHNPNWRRYGEGYDTFMAQASLTIVTYAGSNNSIVLATVVECSNNCATAAGLTRDY
jgi:hypothetical protein